MNTNDTTLVEVTPDYPTIDPVAAWKEGYRAGVEAKTELLSLLREARAQIEYLHEKFQETGSGNALLSRIAAALKEMEEKP